MASADAEAGADSSVAAVTLPEVKVEDAARVIADEEKVEIPQPWFLALVTIAMSAMTSITVAGSLFFLLAAPEKVSPQCYQRETVARGFCTASVISFWTYPIVCCLFVVLVFAKNLVDQRTYYEFLLYKVVIGYGRESPFASPVVIVLLVYAIAAFSALIWYHFSQPTVMVSHVYSSLAYITPIISFLAVICTSWSIRGKLITLPTFLAEYEWAVEHLKDCRCYPVEQLHAGYLKLEAVMDKTTEEVDTGRMVALVEHFTKQVKPPPKDDVEASAADSAGAEKKQSEASKPAAPPKTETNLEKAEEELEEVEEEVKEWVYWEVRLLFNPRLQDDRSRAFRNWAIAYMVAVILAILFSVYIFVCCLITCLELEQVIRPGMVAWKYLHIFSLRPDLGGSTGHKSLKQMAASVAMSAMQTGTRSFYNRASGSIIHFHIGAAAAA